MTCAEPSLLNQGMNLFFLFPLTALFQLTASWQLMESALEKAVGRNQLLHRHSYTRHMCVCFTYAHIVRAFVLVSYVQGCFIFPPCASSKLCSVFPNT